MSRSDQFRFAFTLQAVQAICYPTPAHAYLHACTATTMISWLRPSRLACGLLRSRVVLTPAAGMRNKAKPTAEKAKADAARCALYDKLLVRLRTAVRQGDETTSASVVAECKKAGVPKVNIDRALFGSAGGNAALETVVYEAVGSGGVCFVVQALTDKKSRTAPKVREVLKDAGGELGAAGCAAWAFDRRGWLQYALSADDSEAPSTLEDREMELLEAAMDAGAVDVETNDDAGGRRVIEVFTELQQMSEVRVALDASGHQPTNEAPVYVAKDPMPLDDPEAVEKLEAVLEGLAALDDIEQVFHNVKL